MKKLVIILMVLMGCERMVYDPPIDYVIHRGQHFAFPYAILPYAEKSLLMRVVFTESCLYDESAQQYPGWNKVGYWFRGLHPHTGDGVTFVWRCIEGQLTLGWYGWVNGISPMEAGMNTDQNGVLCEIDPNRTYLLEIIQGDSIEFVVHGIARVKTKFGFNLDKRIGPYFGGLETAPHTMVIQIKKL
jgi:hypothetical protein